MHTYDHHRGFSCDRQSFFVHKSFVTVFCTSTPQLSVVCETVVQTLTRFPIEIKTEIRDLMIFYFYEVKGGFRIEVETKISKLIAYSLAIFIILN